MHTSHKLITALLIASALAWASNYLALFRSQEKISNPESTARSLTPNQNSAVSYRVETVAENLYVPWSMVFTSPHRMLVSERNGSIRIIENDTLIEKPLTHFDEVATGGEEGLMGLALDPNYANNKSVFACLAYRSGDELRDKVVSFQDNGNSITSLKTVIDAIPSAVNHAGCRLLFLPDSTLLITTGDATNKKLPQDLNSLGGKILRINRDGSIPNDNPFPNSPIWSYGHRNPQGLAYDSINNILWETEHGPSVIDGPAGGDEINIISKGNNYGWPLIHHKQKQDGLISPLLEFTPAVAPGGMLFYNGALFPQFTGKLLFAALRGEAIFVLTLDPNNPQRITAFDKIPDIKKGRIRDIVQAPNGSIYFVSSNRDGRGKLQTNDDKIYRLVPQS